MLFHKVIRYVIRSGFPKVAPLAFASKTTPNSGYAERDLTAAGLGGFAGDLSGEFTARKEKALPPTLRCGQLIDNIKLRGDQVQDHNLVIVFGHRNAK